MSVGSVCVFLVSFVLTDAESTRISEAATKLTLRQAFKVETAQSGWYTDLDAAKAESVKSGLPLVLHFEAKWCGACKTMSREVLSLPEVTSVLGREVVGVKIDADRHPNLIRKFHIAVLPSDVFLDADGRILASESGYREKEQYVTSLGNAAAAHAGDKAWLMNPNVKLGKEALETTTGKNCVIKRRGGIIVGLGGFSPVTMTKTMGWKKGNRNYASVYRGVMYYMRNADELKQFEATPQKYAPKLHGCDPVVLSSMGTPLPGAITLGAFVDGNLYFFASETSRELFKKNPGQFIKEDQLVRGEELKSAAASRCCSN